MQRLVGPTGVGYFARRPGQATIQELIRQRAAAGAATTHQHQFRRAASDDSKQKSIPGVKQSFTKKGGGGDGAKKNPQASEAGDEAKSKQLKIVVSALDAPEDKEPPISAEEKERRYQIGRNYVIGRFQQNNRLDHDLTCKINMKQHAIRMLPKNTRLREEALKICDEMQPPFRRHMPMWTPPIPGFDPKKYANIDDEED
jgi:hypothetical protein